jgi:hypothetical protein
MRRSTALLCLLAAGCGTVPTPPVLSRDGQEFGVTDGTFRGRWWNHYERGRSYLDGGFYEEAEADLDVAFGLRAQDQRWARTYGLHFISEYFPNRELGITYFHQGRLEEAAERLETSLAQEHSALAAHYLNETRAALVQQAGGDNSPPDIAAAVDGQILRAEIRDNTYLRHLTIDGEPYPLDTAEQALEISIPVMPRAGARVLRITAEDIAGNVAEFEVASVQDLDGPAISFDAVALPGAISGVVFDPAGVDEVRVGDALAAADAMPDGTLRFNAVIATDAATPLSFCTRDALGNVTEGVVPGTGATVPVRTAHAFRIAGLMDDTWVARQLDHIAQAASVPASGDGIRFANLADGQRYLMDEVVVSIEAADADGISGITLDGQPLDGMLPGARNVHVSRRIRLDGMGEHRVAAVMTDGAGNAAETQAAILREPTAIELPEERMRVALLGNLWEGAGPQLENEAEFAAEEVSRAIFQRQRFDLLSRDALPRVLEEQELRAVLGSRDLEPGLRQVVPADMFAVGKVRRTGDVIEIVLQAVSTETSSILAYADVAGRAATLDDLRELARDLALRFEQEFPRASGTVAQAASAGACFTTIAEADRVRPELPCLIYRYGDPILHPETGAVLGRPTEVIARGTLTEVQAQLSRIALDTPAEGVQVGDHVAMR